MTYTSHATPAYADFPAPVKFDPPLGPADRLPAGVSLPACPTCGEGTVFLNICGKCGSTDPGPVREGD